MASANDTIETDFHAGAPRVDEAYAFEIRSGLYLGLTHAVAEGRHLFGSGEDCDLVLLEPGLATTHAAIVLEGDTIRVEGLAEGVAVEGAGLLNVHLSSSGGAVSASGTFPATVVMPTTSISGLASASMIAKPPVVSSVAAITLSCMALGTS